jgi:ABC-type taurine transport system ATPase subunit
VTVRRGEILAIMGPSGSGKSTLLHCLAGIFTPDTGDVLFDGQIINARGEADRTRLRRTAFGFVFQFGQLVPELTAADNVALPMLLNRIRRKVAYKTAVTWLDKLGLADKGGRRTGSAATAPIVRGRAGLDIKPTLTMILALMTKSIPIACTLGARGLAAPGPALGAVDGPGTDRTGGDRGRPAPFLPPRGGGRTSRPGRGGDRVLRVGRLDGRAGRRGGRVRRPFGR